MDHQLTKMVTKNEDHKEETDCFADEELELERQRETDPFRPLVLVLLQQAREQIREREERGEGQLEDRLPAQRSPNDRL